MISRAFLNALDQVHDKGFRKVFWLGILIAIVSYIGIFLITGALLPEELSLTGWEWFDDFLMWIFGGTFVVVLFFLFPGIATMFMGLFLDDIIDAVETRHYPDDRAPKRLGIGESLVSSMRLGLVIIIINLLALPAYLILWFTAFGPIILYILINGYLLGREYFELVAERHMSAAEAANLRRDHRDKSIMAGMVITGIFMVPVLNLAAPILGVAAMVHLVHAIKAEPVA